MKKVLMTIIVMLLVLPLVVSAAENKIQVRASTDPDEGYQESSDNGVYTKKIPVFIDQITGRMAIEEITIKFTEKDDSDISEWRFEGTDTYDATVLSEQGKVHNVKFKVKSGATAGNTEKVLIGYAVIKLTNAAVGCGFNVGIVKNPSTGAFMDYALIGGSVALIGAIYFATKSKKKMFNV